MPAPTRTTLFVASLLFVFSIMAIADEETSNTVTIIGDQNEAKSIAGSAHVITKSELEKFEYSDINSVLRQIPGVYVRLEDGYGLRPNIGIRSAASGAERSNKITIMEDGIPIAPAPYAASAAYYSPTAARMSGFEVLKGPAAITEGPYTVGGAINYLSTPIPFNREGNIMVETGSNGAQRQHITYGDSREIVGWVIEAFDQKDNGFKSIDFTNKSAGLDKSDYMVKMRVNSSPSDKNYQELLLKILKADETSNQSYLGLTDADFNLNPYRQYAASQNDQINVEHEQLQLSYAVDINKDLSLRAKAYKNDTARNWYKASKIGGMSLGSIIDSANQGDDNAISLLQSEAEGEVVIKHNNRVYTSQGIEFMLDWNFDSGDSRHDLEVGVRIHQDEEDRFQAEDTYWQNIGGSLMLTEAGIFGNKSSNNRLTEADALAMYIRDEIKYGDWTFSPGVRFENVEIRRQEWSAPERNMINVSKDQSNKQREVIPGFGVTYDANEKLRLIGGIHKGFAPSGYKPETDNEESISYELGGRIFLGDLYAEAIFFLNDYDNIVGECTTVSGANCGENQDGSQFNSGAVSVSGIEVMMTYDFSDDAGYKIPLSLNYTYMSGEFDSSFDNSFFGDVQKGDPLTYFPEQQGQLSIGFEHSKGWGVRAAASYVASVCTLVSCEREISTFDTTDAIFNLDLVADYQLTEKATVYAKIENATDEIDVIGRHPAGALVQKDRSAYLGLRVSF